MVIKVDDLHIPVLLDEVIDNMNLKSSDIVVDCTLGFGGHSSRILSKINKGHLYAFDQDEEAIKYSNNRLNKICSNYTIIKSNFDNIKEELNKLGVNKVNCILFDLGVSSVQLDSDRGFTYMRNEKLDMRMDKEQKFSAIDVVNTYSYNDLVRIFFEYGESNFSKSIAKNIVKYREHKKIEYTSELVDIINSSTPKLLKKNPSKQIFQAIRIEVNHELDSLDKALDQAFDLIDVGGRILVISFHSLEDRIVKTKFNKKSNVDFIIKGNPNIDSSMLPKFRLVNKKPIVPSALELEKNSRSLSSKLRIIERIR